MRTRKLITAALGVAGMICAAVGTGAAHAGPLSTTSAAPVRDDFNGDGYRDLAIGTPRAVVDGHSSAGAVVVTYGTPHGSDPARHTVLTQNSPGIPGAAEASDYFGESITSADLDNDGYADLIVGAYGENLDTPQDQGMVTIVWGGDGGLGSGTTLLEPTPRADARFGRGLAAGDFDDDTRPDIAVMTDSLLWVFPEGFTREGPNAAPKKVAGPDGLPPLQSASVSDAAAGDLDEDGADELVVFGTAQDSRPYTGLFTGGAQGLAWSRDLVSGPAGDIGDVDHDGFDDIVTGYPNPPGGSSDPSAQSGYVKVWYGAADGTGSRTRTIHQDTAGVPGANEAGDLFGLSVTVGDSNGDGYADAAVGAPGEDVGSLADAGSVVLLKGGYDGLSGSGAQGFTQDTSGIPGAAESGDRFGQAVRLTDLTREGRAELAVSAPYENGENGALWVLPGDVSGLTATGATSYDPIDFGFGTTGRRFGSVLNH